MLRRAGHTEATIVLARAGFEPGELLLEIIKDEGLVARLPQLMEVAK